MFTCCILGVHLPAKSTERLPELPEARFLDRSRTIHPNHQALQSTKVIYYFHNFTSLFLIVFSNVYIARDKARMKQYHENSRELKDLCETKNLSRKL